MCSKDYGGNLLMGKAWRIKPFRCPYKGDCYYISELGTHSSVDHIGLSGKWEKWTKTILLFWTEEEAREFAGRVEG